MVKWAPGYWNFEYEKNKEEARVMVISYWYIGLFIGTQKHKNGILFILFCINMFGGG